MACATSSKALERCPVSSRPEPLPSSRRRRPHPKPTGRREPLLALLITQDKTGPRTPTSTTARSRSAPSTDCNSLCTHEIRAAEQLATAATTLEIPQLAWLTAKRSPPPNWTADLAQIASPHCQRTHYPIGNHAPLLSWNCLWRRRHCSAPRGVHII